MPIDFMNEDVIMPKEFAERFKSSIQTFHRLVSVGYLGIRLEFTKIGRHTYTSVQAVQRFSDAIMAAKGRGPRTEKPSPSVRARQIARAKAEAQEMGL
jgi:hypothetical protein